MMSRGLSDPGPACRAGLGVVHLLSPFRRFATTVFLGLPGQRSDRRAAPVPVARARKVPGVHISGFVKGVLLVLVLAAGGQTAYADDPDEPNVEILSAGTVVKDQVYYLNARFRLRLKPQMVEALHAGIPLTFTVSVEVYRPRSYIWDAEVALLEQRYELSYQALTQQYVLKNLNSGVVNNFPNLVAASDVLGTIVELPLLDRNLLNPEDEYRGRMRVRLDREELPLPLRLQSYFYSDWTLTSDWYSWPIDY